MQEPGRLQSTGQQVRHDRSDLSMLAHDVKLATEFSNVRFLK